jgi:hypothetical protein
LARPFFRTLTPVRRAARTDDNQQEIAKALRAVGATVTLTHAVGRGFPDMVVGYRGINYLFEVKDGSKPPSRRKLTPDETAWHLTWRGHVSVIDDVAGALRAIGATAD